MNRLGATARNYFRDFLPTRYAEMTEQADPDEYFSRLGEDLENQVVALAPQLAGPDPAGEGYLEKAGRLNMARMQATEIVLRERLYEPNPPETDPEDPTAETAAETGYSGLNVAETVEELRTIASSPWQTTSDPEEILRSGADSQPE